MTDRLTGGGGGEEERRREGRRQREGALKVLSLSSLFYFVLLIKC